MPTDTLAPKVTRAAAGMVLVVYDRQHLLYIFFIIKYAKSWIYRSEITRFFWSKFATPRFVSDGLQTWFNAFQTQHDADLSMFNHSFNILRKKTSRQRIPGPLWGEFTPMFSSQRTNNAERVFMPWRVHGAMISLNIRAHHFDFY